MIISVFFSFSFFHFLISLFGFVDKTCEKYEIQVSRNLFTPHLKKLFGAINGGLHIPLIGF